jgi:hypothetical protein
MRKTRLTLKSTGWSAVCESLPGNSQILFTRNLEKKLNLSHSSLLGKSSCVTWILKGNSFTSKDAEEVKVTHMYKILPLISGLLMNHRLRNNL